MLEENYEKCRKTSLTLVIFNVDDFKLYNQLYGNNEGDKALVHIAQIIKGTVGSNGYCCLLYTSQAVSGGTKIRVKHFVTGLGGIKGNGIAIVHRLTLMRSYN